MLLDVVCAAWLLDALCAACCRDQFQYQFIAVLQGKLHLTIEASRRPRERREHDRPRKGPTITIKKGHVLFFWGSTFAHAAACGADCKRVAGWVCQEGEACCDVSGQDDLQWK